MEDDIVRQRRRKVEELRRSGVEPYFNGFKPAHRAAEIVSRYGSLGAEELERLAGERFSIAGRVMTIRNFGKSAFFHVADSTGRLQAYLKRDVAGDEALAFFKRYVDVGDIVGLEGVLFRTRMGELTLLVERMLLLTKALRSLPEKWHGLKDVETRYRRRYLDLIANPRTREIFAKRTKTVGLIRRFLDERGFVEVETPILQPVPGGAAAKPFVTYHNALDVNLYLRIAPELYLKRLLVGGYEKVYELGRNFRNEGVSTQHNPEFTMVELYQSYATYEDLMELMEEMLTFVVERVAGSLELEYQGRRIDMSRPWKRISVLGALEQELGPGMIEDDERLLQEAARRGVVHRGVRGKAVEGLFERLVGERLEEPTFVYGYPIDVSPLARRSDADPSVTDRFELYVAGREIANAFSELNDPIDQVERFRRQLELKLKGDDEVHEIDADFILALEHGMPPAAGAGIGIDRLVMLLTDSPSIREVLLFPHLRPE